MISWDVEWNSVWNGTCLTCDMSYIRHTALPINLVMSAPRECLWEPHPVISCPPVGTSNANTYKTGVLIMQDNIVIQFKLLRVIA